MAVKKQKNMFENSDVFTTYAQIDCCYYIIGRIYKEDTKPLSPMERAIDAAMGFDKQRMKNKIEKVIPIIEQIISLKKEINADFSYDEKTLNELVKLYGK